MKKILLSIFLLFFFPSIALAPVWPIKTRASEVRTSTSNFDVNLSSTDTNVQKALDTLDELVGGGGGASSLAVEEGDVQVSSPTATIDFGTGLDVTESPTGEANVVVDPDEVITAGTNIDWSGHTLNVDLATGTITQAYDADLDDLADGTLSKSKVQDSTNWDSAYGWGDHSTEGYLASLATGTVTQAYDADLDDLSDGTLSKSKVQDSTTWDTGYTHSQDNTQAHSDYLLNNANDTMDGTLTLTYGVSAGTGVFTGQVQSNSRKLVDQYDFAVCISTPKALGTIATLISPFRSYAVTISTISAQIIGGTNVILMVEQRTIAGIESAGTDIWSGDVTALPTNWTGGATSDFTIPADSALVLVITSVSGDVDRLMIKGIYTKD